MAEPNASQRPRVALCAIMKNEFPYVLEWIAYHRLIGFDPIHIYSNDSTDGSVDLLNALAKLGVVTHWIQRTVPEIAPQPAAYRHMLAHRPTEWIAFLDADEFLVLKQNGSVQDFVARFGDEVSGIAINWRIFGSAGEARYRPEPVIERFLRASPAQWSVNNHYKSIVRAARAASMSAHCAILTSGVYVDARGQPLEGEITGRSKTIETDVAQVNHYVVKSQEEYEGKRRRGSAMRRMDDPLRFTHREISNFFNFHNRNDEEEMTLFAMRDAVRAEIERLRAALRGIGFVFFS